ncbi:hypothetical protein CKQ53_18155 [Lonsdalea britannica]|uniref:Uncharacterized protein n=1 Tax=Lonsdalea britannica TaxID=1082704 RepID=A0AAD0SK27_9GAMM|nr:hypothetical protein CKQ53_18155 [Lonsdalea britannica]
MGVGLIPAQSLLFSGDISNAALTSHQSPVTSHQSPVTSHQSPVTSHQSPVTSHQSPTPTPTPITRLSDPFFGH